MSVQRTDVSASSGKPRKKEIDRPVSNTWTDVSALGGHTCQIQVDEGVRVEWTDVSDAVHRRVRVIGQTFQAEVDRRVRSGWTDVSEGSGLALPRGRRTTGEGGTPRAERKGHVRS